MLKKKLQTLVEERKLENMGNFEVVSDPAAAMIIGGKDCAALVNCGMYTGSCANLTTCGTYDPDN